MYIEEDDLYEEEEGNGRLIKLASLAAALLGFLCVVAFISWNVYRSFSRGAMHEEVRWSDPDAMPWEEREWLMYDAKRGGGEPELFEGQPEIVGGLRYEAKLHRGEEEYGEIELRVRGDGTVEGKWNGEFRRGELEKRYTTMGDKQRRHAANSFRGNIVKTKIYRDEEGEDRSKLYFIASGGLLLEEFDYQMRDSHRIRGTVYVTGWMGSDYSVEGKQYGCWMDFIEQMGKMRPAKQGGEERKELDLFAPGTVEVFEWEGTPVR